MANTFHSLGEENGLPVVLTGLWQFVKTNYRTNLATNNFLLISDGNRKILGHYRNYVL